MFFSICLSKRKKKNAEVIKFLKILKKYVSENKIHFSSRKRNNFSLNKKVIFVFHAIFKLDFITQIIYCIIHRCLCSHFILFLFSYISLYEMEHGNNVNVFLLIQMAKVQDMFKKHRQDCEHPNNAQCDIYIYICKNFTFL